MLQVHDRESHIFEMHRIGRLNRPRPSGSDGTVCHRQPSQSDPAHSQVETQSQGLILASPASQNRTPNPMLQPFLIPREKTFPSIRRRCSPPIITMCQKPKSAHVPPPCGLVPPQLCMPTLSVLTPRQRSNSCVIPSSVGGFYLFLVGGFMFVSCRRGQRSKGCGTHLVLVGLGHDGVVAGVLGLAVLEAVLEAPRDVLEVAHAAGAGGLPALGLLTPVDCASSRSASSRCLHAFVGAEQRTLAGLGSGEAARRALVLLDVQRAATASTAQSVRLVVALTEAGGTLRHLGCCAVTLVVGWRS